MGRSRGGLTTKIHALVDADGRPIRLKLTAGQAHDARSAADKFETVRPGQILLAAFGVAAAAAAAGVPASCGRQHADRDVIVLVAALEGHLVGELAELVEVGRAVEGDTTEADGDRKRRAVGAKGSFGEARADAGTDVAGVLDRGARQKNAEFVRRKPRHEIVTAN
ncbi:hypothetical protein FBZ99_1122 [Rhizobium sp. ERR 1071]|nr:hypothetical protein FBZ99_1122 [Rhizobium sp. ERR1071]